MSLRTRAEKAEADAEDQAKWATEYLARAERAEAESAGRLKVLNEKADELRREWQRAERAEAALAIERSVVSGTIAMKMHFEAALKKAIQVQRSSA